MTTARVPDTAQMQEVRDIVSAATGQITPMVNLNSTGGAATLADTARPRLN